jgi:hypothetical protein
MSRRLLAALTAVVAFGLGCGTSSGSGADRAPEQRSAKPQLLVAELYPLTVRGVRFKPGERVTVSVDGGRRGAKSMRAGDRGGFTARFFVTIPRCETVTIRAVGGRGSRAVTQVPRPDCREP